MESTFNHDGDGSTKSLKRSWQHCKELFSASTASEAWQSFQILVDALPLWSLVALPVLATILVIDRSLFLVPLAAGAFLFAIYATVKRAVTEAIRDNR